MDFELLSRQIRYLGEERQEKLDRAKVVVVGAGGLGSYVSQMLIRCGVGFVRVIDRDLVDESNLARVSVYTRDDLGKPKAFVVKEKFKKLNPGSRVDGIEENLTYYNAKKLISGFEVVVDCTDNMETRYEMNRFCFENRIPWVYGTVSRDEGFSSTFSPSGKPCFNCLYPRGTKSPGSPEDSGVISPIVGMTASWQAMEVIKILTGLSRPNYGKLLRINLKTSGFDFLNVKQREDCEVCG